MNFQTACRVRITLRTAHSRTLFFRHHSQLISPLNSGGIISQGYHSSEWQNFFDKNIRFFSDSSGSHPPPTSKDKADTAKLEDHNGNILTSTSSTETSNATTLIYEGPFAALALRLKRVSITTAAVSLVGMPLIIFLNGGGVPASGQIAVGGTAILAATGSTAALSYCFSPYVHSLEWVAQAEEEESSSDGQSVDKRMVMATTRNIFARKVETVFDIDNDVSPANVNRPFCNFMAKGVPMYVHPEIIYDEEIRNKLLLEVPGSNTQSKDDDDGII